MTFLLSATPWADLPGGEEALQRVLSQHPWIAVLQILLVSASLLLNLALVIIPAFDRSLFRPRLSPSPWKFEKGLRVLALFAGAYFGILIIGTALRQEFGVGLQKLGISELHLTILGTSAAQLIALGLLFIFSRDLRRQTGSGLVGYWKGPGAARALAGVPLFILVILPIGLVFAALQIFFQKIGWRFDPQPLVTLLRDTPETWFVVTVSVFAIAVAPVVEEMLFRGILYPTLKSRFGMWPAVLLNSFFFALLHLHLPTMIPLFLLAAFFSLAFEMTGSLGVCIVAHSLFNTMSVALIWLLRSSQ